MAKRMISVRVEEEILAAFDKVAWERHQSRTALLEELMVDAVAMTKAVLAAWRPKSGPNAPVLTGSFASEADARMVVDGGEHRMSKAEEAREILREVAARMCPHPKDRRVKFAWGSKCGVCNSIVK